MTESIPQVSLNSGTTIPQLGFGVFLVDPADTQRVVEDALEIGYRHIDTATGYNNETEVGKAIAATGIRREELFITTKLSNDDHRAGDVRGGFERSLDRLGTGYLDLYLIHWPLPGVDKYIDTWRTIQTFAADGRAKAAGVCNFTVAHLTRLLAETDLVPAVNQVELHPAFAQRELQAFGTEHDIRTEAWGPLGQAKYDLFGLAPIRAAAAAHDVTGAQVVLRWHIQHGRIIFPKSTHRARLQENFAIFDFTLTDDEMAAIDGLDHGKRVGSDPDVVN
ncbi:MAG TPA: aldo/keto reductase [Microbacteriaceae bacterium]|nr:aldo/keto reductase [Microbacteriaceae bacterium]